MSAVSVGVLHPGAMGATVVSALVQIGQSVLWDSTHRSEATIRRAEEAGAQACESLAELCERCDVLISVCPPENALELAISIADLNYLGRYVDVNAVSPGTAMQIALLFPDRFVDGGIIGPPATTSGTTRLYLSGPGAPEIVQLFDTSLLEARVLDGSETAASALKMCYAAWTKGSAALLLNSRALAEALGVGQALDTEWAISQPRVLERAQTTATGTAPKAWRFAGEMDQIAATFAATGLPDGFHEGAADFYGRLTQFKDQNGVSLADLLAALTEN